MKVLLLFLLAVIAMPCKLTAQKIELVKDINKTPLSAFDYVREEAVANNLLFILAGEGSNGLQLWRSDGTDEGTFRLADNYQIQASNPTYLTSAGTFVCFRMIYQNDNWLFRSDGTNEGTYPLHKLSNSGSTFWGIGNINGTMFFSGAQDAGGRQLWKTDGTIAGTQLVKDFGISNKGETGPEQFFNFNGKLSFVIHNEEEIDVDAVLWQSDGTEAGTVPGPALSDGFIQPAVMGNYVYFPEGSSLKRSDGKTITTVKDGFIWLRQPFVVGQSIYFSANHAGSGEELWKSDGTAEGTALVKDIVSGAEDSDPTGFTDVAGTLFFKAQSSGHWRLWKSDGSTQGTVQVSHVEVNSYTYFGQNDLVAVGNQIVFPVGAASTELWKSDGTEEGTQMLASLGTEMLGKIGDEVYFAGTNSSGTQLYKTDLTVAGTKAITNRKTTASSSPQQLTDVNGTAFFIASSTGTGYELWKSNGTEDGTIRLKEGTDEYKYTPPKNLTNVNGTLFYVVNSTELWKSNGTAEGTVQIPVDEDPNFGGTFNQLNAFGEKLLFEHRGALWTSDGSAAGTIPITERVYGISGITNINNNILFGSSDYGEDENGNEARMNLWKSNGSPGGSTLVRNFPHTYGFNPVTFKGKIYFGAWDGVNSIELWKSDGTAQGTQIVSEVIPSLGNFLMKSGSLVSSGDYLYYITNDDDSFPLVRTDGTAGGTTVIKDLFPGGHLGDCRLYAAMGLVFFTMHHLETNQELLWRTDGTPEGTFQLAAFDTYESGDVNRQETPIRIKTELDGKVLFVPFDRQNGDQLWVTDGTIRGTKALTTTGPNPAYFTVSPTVSFGNLFYFPMYGTDTGRELWQSDGTEAGTHITTNLDPDGDAVFRELAIIGNSLFLSADNGSSGVELYKYKLPDDEYVTISPIADAYVRNVTFEKTNFGNEPELSIKAGSIRNFQRKTYLKFPLHDAGGFVSAKLRIYGHNYENNLNVSLAVRGVENDNWTETGINWQNAPSGNRKILDSAYVNNQLQYYELDVTDFIRTQLNGDKVASFQLTNPADQNVRLFFNSRESAANPPQLIFTHQTHPAARLAAEQHIIPSETKPETSGIYPNPAGKHFTLYVSKAHTGKIDLQLINSSGNSAWTSKYQSDQPVSKVEVDVSSRRLPPGMYVMKIQSTALTETTKVLLTE